MYFQETVATETADILVVALASGRTGRPSALVGRVLTIRLGLGRSTKGGGDNIADGHHG